MDDDRPVVVYGDPYMRVPCHSWQLNVWVWAPLHPDTSVVAALWAGTPCMHLLHCTPTNWLEATQLGMGDLFSHVLQ